MEVKDRIPGSIVRDEEFLETVSERTGGDGKEENQAETRSASGFHRKASREKAGTAKKRKAGAVQKQEKPLPAEEKNDKAPVHTRAGNRLVAVGDEMPVWYY